MYPIFRTVNRTFYLNVYPYGNISIIKGTRVKLEDTIPDNDGFIRITLFNEPLPHITIHVLEEWLDK